MIRGRPFQPGNQFGRGRPRGSGNKKAQLPQELLDLHADEIVHKSIEIAQNGDSQILRFLLGHLLPPPRELPVKVGPLPMGTAAELVLNCIN